MKMVMSIRMRLTIIMMAVSIAPLVIVGVILSVQGYGTQQHQAYVLQQQVAQRVSAQTQAFFVRIEDELRLTVELQGLRLLDRGRQAVALESLITFNDSFDSLVLLDRNGNTRAVATRLMGYKDVNHANEREFTVPQSTASVYYSSVAINSETGEPLMTVSMPLMDFRSGAPDGVLVLNLRIKKIWDLIAGVRVEAGQSVYILDNGKVVAHRNPSVALQSREFSAVEGEGIQKGLDNPSVILAVDRIALGQESFTVIAEQATDSALALAASTVTITVILIVIALVVAGGLGFFLVRRIVQPLDLMAKTAKILSTGDLTQKIAVGSRDELGVLAEAFNGMIASLNSIILKVRDITMNVNSASKEIEAASHEQTTAANEHASGITEVSATLEELSITAKQITANAGALVVASEEAITLLKMGEKDLLVTVKQLDEVGIISRGNTEKIGELGKKSDLISEMVEIIKDVSNKTNMLSINASIEASRAGEAGKGFSVVAAEIRELSKETISSAKKVGEAGREIQGLLDSIIVSSESESHKVLECGATVKSLSENLENIVTTINDNYNFTQKIDVSIKQQEVGSGQAAQTMKQMAEISQQSAETARQTTVAVKNIVTFSTELTQAVEHFTLAE